MKKKGEITTTQIVMIIVLIVSFIVILYFFHRLNLGVTTNSEICHNSVVLKSKSSSIVGELNCKTDYVCISGGGRCANMNPTVIVKVDPNNKDEIMKAIADQMAQCWWMFGEGKLNYGDKGIFGDGGCALCSVVEFGNNILSKNYKLTYDDFYNYLSNTKKSKMQTYLDYIYGTNDLNNLLNTSDVLKENEDSNIVTNEDYVVVTGFHTGWFWGFLGKNSLTPPVYIKTSLVSQLKCSNFITKA